MKKSMIILISILFTISTIKAFSKEKVNLVIIIENVENINKPINIGFYKKGSDFPERGKDSFNKKYMPKSKGKHKIEIPNVEIGEYAIALYQDVNKDGKLNTNFVGIPKEPYAFSRNFAPTLSAPDFEDCSFLLNRDKEIKIKLLD